MTTTNVFDGTHLHVMPERCPTCIFRPGNPMHLEPGRVDQMEATASADGGCIPCHKTTHGARDQEAICRGFFDRHRRTHPALVMASALDIVVLDAAAS